MHTHIDDYIKALEEMGYTHEEAKKFVEQATQPVDISYMDEEFQRFVDKFNSIGCTSFIIIPTKEKPIKVSFEGEPEVKIINCDHIEIKQELHGAKAERIINNIFGTTDIGVLNCSDINEDVYYCPTCKRILELIDIDTCMNTPNEFVDYCLECQGEVVNLKYL